MERKFVKVSFNLDCDWEGIAPIYRIYVNDELFSERHWIWDSHISTQQILQIKAPPGRYNIRVYTVGPCLAKLRAWGNTVDVGSAFWADDSTLMIRNAS